MEAGDDGQEGCRKGQKGGYTEKGQGGRGYEAGRNARLEETIDREENGRSQKVKYLTRYYYHLIVHYHYLQLQQVIAKKV